MFFRRSGESGTKLQVPDEPSAFSIRLRTFPQVRLASSLQGQLGPVSESWLLWMLIARWKVEARYIY